MAKTTLTKKDGKSLAIAILAGVIVYVFMTGGVNFLGINSPELLGSFITQCTNTEAVSLNELNSAITGYGGFNSPLESYLLDAPGHNGTTITYVIARSQYSYGSNHLYAMFPPEGLECTELMALLPNSYHTMTNPVSAVGVYNTKQFTTLEDDDNNATGITERYLWCNDANNILFYTNNINNFHGYVDTFIPCSVEERDDLMVQQERCKNKGATYDEDSALCVCPTTTDEFDPVIGCFNPDTGQASTEGGAGTTSGSASSTSSDLSTQSTTMGVDEVTRSDSKVAMYALLVALLIGVYYFLFERGNKGFVGKGFKIQKFKRRR